MGRGWGVRTLHDLPIGTFISVYSGEIFTSEQADERGKLLGDEYQADLDFFEVKSLSKQFERIFVGFCRILTMILKKNKRRVMMKMEMIHHRLVLNQVRFLSHKNIEQFSF